MATFNSDGLDLVATSLSRAAIASRDPLPEPAVAMEFKLTLDGGVCTDEGAYLCRHDSGQTSSGDVEISSKVDKVATEIISLT